MRVFLAAVTLVIAAWSAQPALAQTRQQVEQQQAAALEGWLAEMASWSTGYQAHYLEQSDVVLSLIEGMEVAAEYYTSGNHAAGRTWATGWSAQMRAALHRPVEAARALDRPPPPLPADIAALVPPLVQMREQVTTMPGIYIELLETTERDMNALITAIAATAGGDDAAAEGLVAKTFLVSIAQLRGEIVMSEASLPMVRVSGGFQEHLIVSGIATNHAAIAVMAYEQRLLERQRADATATAAEVQRQAEAMMAAMDRFDASAARSATTIDAMPDTAAPLRERIRRVLASLPETAQVERRIAAHLMEIVQVLRGPEAGDVDRLLEAWDPIDPLLEQRLALDAARRAIIAGG